MPVPKVYVTAAEAAEYLNLPSVTALYCFLHRRRKAGFNVKTYRRGRHLLFKPADLDACLTVEEAPQRWGQKRRGA